VNKRKGTDTHHNHKAAFEEFEGGYGPENAPLAAVRI
jgi:hypothetical protein